MTIMATSYLKPLFSRILVLKLTNKELPGLKLQPRAEHTVKFCV